MAGHPPGAVVTPRQWRLTVASVPVALWVVLFATGDGWPGVRARLGLSAAVLLAWMLLVVWHWEYRCAGFLRDGEPCSRAPQEGRRYCVEHDPDRRRSVQ